MRQPPRAIAASEGPASDAAAAGRRAERCLESHFPRDAPRGSSDPLHGGHARGAGRRSRGGYGGGAGRRSRGGHDGGAGRAARGDGNGVSRTKRGCRGDSGGRVGGCDGSRTAPESHGPDRQLGARTPARDDRDRPRSPVFRAEVPSLLRAPPQTLRSAVCQLRTNGLFGPEIAFASETSSLVVFFSTEVASKDSAEFGVAPRRGCVLRMGSATTARLTASAPSAENAACPRVRLTIW